MAYLKKKKKKKKSEPFVTIVKPVFVEGEISAFLLAKGMLKCVFHNRSIQNNLVLILNIQVLLRTTNFYLDLII